MYSIIKDTIPSSKLLRIHHNDGALYESKSNDWNVNRLSSHRNILISKPECVVKVDNIFLGPSELLRQMNGRSARVLPQQ